MAEFHQSPTEDSSATATERKSPTNFVRGFEKKATPKWAKMIAEGKLSPSSVARIKATMGGKTREIKHLGEGTFQIADLVMHPKHGLVVRKTPKLNFYDQVTTDHYTNLAKEHLGHMRDLAKKLDNHPGIANLKDAKGAVGYYEYATQKSTGRNPRDTIKEIKKHLPYANDFRKNNIIKGKVIDFQPTGTQRVPDGIVGDKVNDVKGYSKGHFLGGKPSIHKETPVTPEIRKQRQLEEDAHELHFQRQMAQKYQDERLRYYNHG